MSRRSDLPVLDLGSGPGVIALSMAQRGIRVIAVDPSEEMLTTGQRAAAEHGVSGIAWRIGDSTRLVELPAVSGVGIGWQSMDRRGLDYHALGR